jgi:uncharacterized protein YjbI with pentapeptide repeats
VVGVVARTVPFVGADLTGADLTHTDLERADFTGANLTGVDLKGAKLLDATFGWTKLSGIANLHLATGLDSIRHTSPSVLDEVTLQNSVHELPDVFLRGCGYSDGDIEDLRAKYPAPGS